MSRRAGTPRFVYMALFADGTIRKHTSDIPKTHVLRLTVARNGHKRFLWCENEGKALYHAEGAMNEPQLTFDRIRHTAPEKRYDALQQCFAWFYSDLEVVELREISADPITPETMIPLTALDPTPLYYRSPFEPEAVVYA